MDLNISLSNLPPQCLEQIGKLNHHHHIYKYVKTHPPFQIKHCLSNPFNQPLLRNFHMQESERWLWHDPCLQNSESYEADGCLHRKLKHNKCGECQRRSLHEGLLKHRGEGKMSTQESRKSPLKISRNMMSKHGKGKVSRIHFAIPNRLRKTPCHKDAQ